MTIEKLKSETEEVENKIHELMLSWEKREENAGQNSGPLEIEIEKLHEQIKDLEFKTENEISVAV